jgi:hypothetical protein
MLVFVKKADLILDPVPVLAYYPDAAALPIDYHGSDATMLCLPENSVDVSTIPPRLISGFRNDMEEMVNDEAERRIEIPFPAYMQRNCNSDINASITKYGSDPSTWPTDAQQRKAEGDRGWTYVADVRQTADALSTQTTISDPTDDSHWPAMISPIYVPPPS